MTKSTLPVVAAALALLAAFILGTGPRSAVAQGGARQPFRNVLLVPPDDRDYIVTRAPEGGTIVLTDIVAYNAADGKGGRVQESALSLLWVGAYQDGKAVPVINRLRVSGNETERWSFQTGLEIGARELVISSDKAASSPTPVLVHLSGYTYGP